MSGLRLAIDAVGSQAELARRLDTSPMRIANWKRRGIPPEQVLRVVRAVGGRVRPYDLRPDIYPDPHWMPPGLEERTQTGDPGVQRLEPLSPFPGSRGVGRS